ncbi:hypothetical protein Glove_88g35 [Diversispora epigaea]|uniref:Uncharacterized protein n=1 Tax=Diversispora epigaea TaxID=1348612 RepID=A0A397J6L4_9GLOM|nr:hypothetical protein Glove_88g35 [Diversispora epigaea]
MKIEQRKVSGKNRQNGDIDFFLNSPDPTPISFFRLTHPTQRRRAIDKYKKCLAIAINRSRDANLNKLRAVDNNEEAIQRDWEIWLKEKKAILACRTSHNTILKIQQDFTSTMKIITGITKNDDDGEHNNFALGSYCVKSEELSDDNENDDNEPLVPKRLKFNNNDIDDKVYGGVHSSQIVYSGVTRDSPNNPSLVLGKDDAPSDDNAPDENGALDSSYFPGSEESNDDIEPKQNKFQYEWFIGLGVKESILNDNETKWTVGTIDISNSLLEYRNLSIKKASENKIENAIEMLSLNHIFLLDENSPSGISELIGPESLKKIFENIRSEYTSYKLLDKDILRCHEISKVANENFKGCKSLLRKWQREVGENDDDLILEVFESIFKCFPSNTNRENAKEDTFVHEIFELLITPIFTNSDLKCEWSTDVSNPSLQGLKTDFSIYIPMKNKKYYLLVAKINSAKFISSTKIDFVNRGLVKIGNEMKDMLDKCINDGIKNKDLSICGLLVEGFQCSVLVMDLKYSAIYRMIHLGKFYFPRSIHNLNVLSIAIEELMQIKNIIFHSVELGLSQCNRDPEITPMRNKMMRPSFQYINEADNELQPCVIADATNALPLIEPKIINGKYDILIWYYFVKVEYELAKIELERLSRIVNMQPVTDMKNVGSDRQTLVEQSWKMYKFQVVELTRWTSVIKTFPRTQIWHGGNKGYKKRNHLDEKPIISIHTRLTEVSIQRGETFSSGMILSTVKLKSKETMGSSDRDEGFESRGRVKISTTFLLIEPRIPITYFQNEDLDVSVCCENGSVIVGLAHYNVYSGRWILFDNNNDGVAGNIGNGNLKSLQIELCQQFLLLE